MIKVLRSFGILVLLVLCYASAADARRKWKFDGDTEDFEFEEETQAQRRPKSLRGGAQHTQDVYEVTGSGRPQKSKTSEDSELCLALRCSPDEYCLVKNENVALCAPLKKPSSKDRKLLPMHSKMSKVTADEEEDQEDEDDDEDDDEDESSSSNDDDSSSSEYDDESTEGLLKQTTCAPCQVAKPTFVCGSDNKTYSSPCRIHYHNCVHRSNVKMACNGFCPCSDSKAKHEQKQKQMSQRWNNFVNKYKMTMSQQNNNNNKGNNNSNNGDSSSTKTPSAAKTDYITKSQKPMKSDSSSQFPFKSPNSGSKPGKNQGKNENVGNPPFAEDKQRQKGHNSALSEKVPLPGTTGDKSECNAHDLEVMENRLLDWFSVVMAEAKKNKSRRRSRGFGVTFPSRCQQEVQWIFVHLDSDINGRLGLKELYDLEHDAREHCIKPFLEHCDSNQDVLLTPAEWCACFDQSERPCLSAKSRTRSGLPGNYMPSCDEDGYYKSTQCHSSVGLCWCVDKHGVEYANTRTRGKADCDSIIGNSRSSIEETEDEDDEDSMIEGSADQPLDI